jgi:DNA-binding NarL/FixJ family response regulator
MGNASAGSAKRQKKKLPSPKRILIVDDIEHIRKLICAALEGEPGLAVCGEAVDGLDAIEKAPGLRPDLIVLDLSMPRLDGIQAAKKLKKILPQAPIILFTMHEGLMKGVTPREFGVDAIVAKDRGMSVLGNLIRDLLNHATGT